MKVLNIAIFVFLFVIQVYSLPNGALSVDNPTDVKGELKVGPLPYTTDIPESNATYIPPQPPVTTTPSDITTPTPDTTTPTPKTTTPTPKTTTPTPKTTTLTPKTTTPTPKTTTQTPKTTTLTPETTTSSNSTVAPDTTTISPPYTTTAVPHSHTQRFDFPSFIGGIMLTLGLLAIAFVSHKFYKARTDRNYHTL